jgi:hypothetical protein
LVASGLVWRFGTLDCVSDNLACFEDGFGGSGSFLDVGSHRFYVAKPFPEEVTNVLDPPRSARPPLERLPLQEQNAPLPEQDTSDIAIMDLRTPFNRVIDSAQVTEALERTRLVLLSRAAEE